MPDRRLFFFDFEPCPTNGGPATRVPWPRGVCLERHPFGSKRQSRLHLRLRPVPTGEGDWGCQLQVDRAGNGGSKVTDLALSQENRSFGAVEIDTSRPCISTSTRARPRSPRCSSVAGCSANGSACMRIGLLTFGRSARGRMPRSSPRRAASQPHRDAGSWSSSHITSRDTPDVPLTLRQRSHWGSRTTNR